MTVTLLKGPDLVKEERGVHIIFVPDDAVPCQSHADPTPDELKQVASHIGPTQETDVIVFGGRPWHFAGNALRKHPGVHHTFPNTVLKLRRSTRDRAVWWSEKPFTITAIEQEDPKDANRARYPFSQPPETRPQSTFGGTIFVARSTVPVDAAYGQEYKISFQMEGRTIDPNMDCINN